MNIRLTHSNLPDLALDSRNLVMLISLIVSLIMLVGKLTAYFMTNSAAILADAAESVVHLAATSFAAFSLWLSNRPADANHPYGHGRIAYFSAGFEGALVFIASLAVIGSGVYELNSQSELMAVGTGLVITTSLALINLALGLALVWVGRGRGSMILVANGQHVLTDVYTTLAAIIGLGLVLITGREILDPLAAILIGFLIMYNGYGLMRSAVAGLMDELSPEMRERLMASIEKHLSETAIREVHEIRARRVDHDFWLEMHVLVKGSMSVADAHEAVTEFERAIQEDFPGLQLRVNSHMEPVEHGKAHPGGH